MDIVLTSVLTFASTNIDDLFLLTLFFGDKRFSARDICLGQYLGIGLLLVLSYLGVRLGSRVDIRYVGLLGVIPIYLGISRLVGLSRISASPDEPGTWNNKLKSSQGFWAVASVTFSNGGDNIGTYIPLFSTLDNTGMSIMLFIFLIMVAIWLIGANYLSRHPLLARSIDRFGHFITPVILILLGLYILFENRSFTLLNYR